MKRYRKTTILVKIKWNFEILVYFNVIYVIEDSVPLLTVLFC